MKWFTSCTRNKAGKGKTSKRRSGIKARSNKIFRLHHNRHRNPPGSPRHVQEVHTQMGPQNARVSVRKRVRVRLAKTFGQSEERSDQRRRTCRSGRGVMQLSSRATRAHPGSANCARTHTRTHARTRIMNEAQGFTFDAPRIHPQSPRIHPVPEPTDLPGSQLARAAARGRVHVARRHPIASWGRSLRGNFQKHREELK